MADEFTHINERGEARMVDVGDKPATKREAVAAGKICFSDDCFAKVRDGASKKGDILGTARIAGIMAAKRTSELIPLCHQIALTKVELVFSWRDAERALEARCSARCGGQTGVEMEALTGCTVALLTVYDMCKALDRGMEILNVSLLRKSGGASGEYMRAGSDV